MALAWPAVRKALPADGRIRVLIVDDSVVIRRLLTQALGEDGQLEVVGSAANGALALEAIPKCRPDVVTLDMEMPVMDGLETLRHLRKLYPDLPVIMFSTLTRRGGSATVEALSLGASDYVTKPSGVGDLDNGIAALRLELIPKIKQFFVLGNQKPAAAIGPARAAMPKMRTVRSAVVIGVSTGGPNALAAVLPMFPANFPLPILIVQHMPPDFTRALAERLNATSALQIEEAADGCAVTPGKALIAPGDFHMVLERKRTGVVVKLHQGPQEHSCRPSVDVLFRSAAETYGGSAITVMLTGMGNDGLQGTAALHQRGAYVIAQDAASSVVWGMPGAVVNAGLAHSVVDLSCITPEILKQI